MIMVKKCSHWQIHSPVCSPSPTPSSDDTVQMGRFEKAKRKRPTHLESSSKRRHIEMPPSDSSSSSSSSEEGNPQLSSTPTFSRPAKPIPVTNTASPLTQKKLKRACRKLSAKHSIFKCPPGFRIPQGRSRNERTVKLLFTDPGWPCGTFVMAGFKINFIWPEARAQAKSHRGV
ncbi:hypothetical protein H0H92_014117, partial [Tricholoma furcatifolium]